MERRCASPGQVPHSARQIAFRYSTKVYLVAVKMLFIAALAGCGDGRPSNPALEVFENPPDEMSTESFREVSMKLKNADLLTGPVVLQVGEKFQVEAKIVRRDASPSSFSGMTMFHVRLKPEGTSAKAWRNFPYSDEYVGSIGQDGIGSFQGTVAATAGVYDVRCYVLSHKPTEEKPTFEFVGRGRVRITPEAHD